MTLRTALEHILEFRGHDRVIDLDDHLEHRDTVLETVATAPERQHTFRNRRQISINDSTLKSQKKRDRWRIDQQLNRLLCDRIAWVR